MPSRAVFAIGALALLSVWITWRAKSLESRLHSPAQAVAIINKPAPKFRLQALDGRAISLEDYRGKKVVVSFWASWCAPCRLELPVLRSFFDKAYRRNGNFEILTINLDESRDAAEEAAQQVKLPFPVLLDPGQKTANAFGVEGIPALFIIGANGRVDYAGVGFDASLEMNLARRLGVDTSIFLPGGAPESSRH